ncbi:MAG: enoyl-CoA hydratase/isomerase family protein [Alphaproteobacteria bacterium]|nr:enoyl-CoA hydratase/isomerase family protein [Alphaproteobacteria bacterium]
MEDTITLDLADGIAVLTLNRPERMNALNAALKTRLGEAIGEVAANEAARVLILTGAGGKAFCAGADIRERAASEQGPADFMESQRRTHALFSAIAELRKPVIAALNGVALGGGLEIALCCDFRIAARSARLGLTEVNLGVVPAGGGTQRLARLVGTAAAKRLIMTGTILTADQALTIGLIDEVVADDALMARARALADELAAKPPLALRFAKMAIDQGAQTDLRSALEFELYAASILFASEDRKEGMRAFLEKRKPVFKGR